MYDICGWIGVALRDTSAICLAMKKIETFADLVAQLSARHESKRIAVVCPYDESTIGAVAMALKRNAARFVLLGTAARLAVLPAEWATRPDVQILETATDADAAQAATAIARNGEADVVMKGLIGTDTLLKAVLNKETGILPAGNVLTHLAVAQLPGYHKLIFFSDVAVIPYPTLAQREAILRYDLATCRRLGIEHPNVALIHFTEKVNPKFPNSTDYVSLIEKAKAGAFGNVEMGGPMDVKTACDAHSAQIKGIESPVCGNADLLIFPNIESGNTFYKTITVFAGAVIAGMLQGAMVPVVLPSRSDSAESKFYSLVMAVLTA